MTLATTDKKRTSKIHSWKPKDYQVIVERDGKLFVCHFERLFGHADKLSLYDRFLIGKESYINQLDVITAYTNFFINNYDFENELVTAYLKIKFSLDKDREHLIYNEHNMTSYIDFIYETMFTPTMIKKIIDMVEENYLDDIESEDDDKKKYLKNDKKHLESLEFTNQHIKVLLEISFGMKIMSPVLFHFIQINGIKIEKDSDIIYMFYKKLFELFGYGNTYELYCEDEKEYDYAERRDVDVLKEEGITEQRFRDLEFEKGLEPTLIDGEERYYFTEDGKRYYIKRSKIDMYSKLYVYVKAKVLESNANNQTIFAQREIFGTDVFSVIHLFVRKVLISENVVKYKFNEHWNPKLKRYSENIVG